MNKYKDKLLAFEDNWDSYGVRKPSAISIEIAMGILNQVGDPDLVGCVYPTSDESIMIEHKWNENKITWEIDYDGCVGCEIIKFLYFDVDSAAALKINLTNFLK